MPEGRGAPVIGFEPHIDRLRTVVFPLKQIAPAIAESLHLRGPLGQMIQRLACLTASAASPAGHNLAHRQFVVDHGGSKRHHLCPAVRRWVGTRVQSEGPQRNAGRPCHSRTISQTVPPGTKIATGACRTPPSSGLRSASLRPAGTEDVSGRKMARRAGAG